MSNVRRAPDGDQTTHSSDDQDPFLSALEAAEIDDEPCTPDQQEAAEEGWEEYQRREGIPLGEVRRRLPGEADVEPVGAD